MEKEYLDIINNINGITRQYVANTFYFEKLNKNLLCVYLFGGAHTSILLYDDKHSIKEVGEIRYNCSKDRIFISQFECDYDFQRCGLGRFMFNLALAHADSVGATNIYGYASPTDAIKGVSGNGVSYKEETMKLLDIYKGLGCKITKKPNGYDADSMWEFSQQWNSGEKLNSLPLEQKQFLHKMVNMQKSLRK